MGGIIYVYFNEWEREVETILRGSGAAFILFSRGGNFREWEREVKIILRGRGGFYTFLDRG